MARATNTIPEAVNPSACAPQRKSKKARFLTLFTLNLHPHTFQSSNLLLRIHSPEPSRIMKQNVKNTESDTSAHPLSCPPQSKSLVVRGGTHICLKGVKELLERM